MSETITPATPLTQPTQPSSEHPEKEHVCFFCTKPAKESKVITLGQVIGDDTSLKVRIGENSKVLKQTGVALAHIQCFIAFSVLNSEAIARAWGAVQIQPVVQKKVL